MVEVDPNEEGQKCHPDSNPTELELKIARQLEYYFGDINLNRDRFLQEQIKVDDGWVPLETMLKFNRLAQLTTEEPTIVKAIKKSKSKLLEVSEDGKKIRRSPAVPLEEMNEEKRKEIMSRTLYIKGFDKEETKLAELLEHFPKYGGIDNVVMRNYQDKATKTWHFKGSVFIVFTNKEDAERVLNIDEFKYKDAPLIKKWQEEYLEEKRKERYELQKGRKNKSAKKTNEEQETDKESAVEGFEPGRVVRLTQISGNISREDIREAIEGMGVAVGFIDFSRGETEATVRLDENDSAKELVNKVKEESLGKLSINGCEMEIDALEGEEELKYLEKAKEMRNQRRNNSSKHKKKSGRGGFRGGRGGTRRSERTSGNRKRPGSPTNAPSKKLHGGD